MRQLELTSSSRSLELIYFRDSSEQLLFLGQTTAVKRRAKHAVAANDYFIEAAQQGRT